MNDNGPGKSEIFTDTLAKRKKTDGRSLKRIARKRIAILIRVSGIFSFSTARARRNRPADITAELINLIDIFIPFRSKSAVRVTSLRGKNSSSHVKTFRNRSQVARLQITSHAPGIKLCTIIFFQIGRNRSAIFVRIARG